MHRSESGRRQQLPGELALGVRTKRRTRRAGDISGPSRCRRDDNRYPLVAAAAICALVVAQAGSRTARRPRLDVSAERASLGAPLTVQGYDFAYEDAVELMLIGSDEDWSIGTATADIEGSFTRGRRLDDMREGEYTVSARTLHHVVESAPSSSRASSPRRATHGSPRSVGRACAGGALQLRDDPRGRRRAIERATDRNLCCL